VTLDQVGRAIGRPNLTPALRRVLDFIAGGEERGRMVLQVTASGGRASSQLQALRNAGYVEYYDPPEGGPDRIRITAPGRGALNDQASLRYRRDDDRYLVYLGDDRIGFVRYAPDKRRWNAADATMSYIRWVDTRDAAGKALHRRFVKMMRDGRL
jgi:rhodanese-related sulfurtransferase